MRMKKIGCRTSGERICPSDHWCCAFFNLRWQPILIFGIFAILLSWPLHVFAEVHPKTARTVALGMSTALSGPASFLGQNVRAGVAAAINEKNQSGGISGQPLELICLDDGYEPTRTAPNMRRLIHQDKVLSIIGNVGTPTAVSAIPIANASQTVFFGAISGAGILRKTPADRFVINYRASYAEEVSAMIEALITFGRLSPGEIAFFTQRDSYGDAGFAGGVEALKKHGLKDESTVLHSRYERNTLAVEHGLADIMLAEKLPRAIIMIGTYAPCAAFIRLAKEYSLDAFFLNVSFVGAEPLAQNLGKTGDGVIITQVVPHFGGDLPIVQRYRQALTAYQPSLKASFSSLEGFIAAQILFKGLEGIKGPLTREAVVDALENLDHFDIGMDQSLRLNNVEHQACHRVWPMVLENGRAVPFDWRQLAQSAARSRHE
jgi:ABC-type branched-subunit amino acid transport system substrate-binding protein